VGNLPSNSRHVYYNEHDPEKCAWLRELISRGVIANGEVDERSIADVRLDDLRGFSQCHFFAGIGVWSYALRLAGWPDDRPVWTGSCPCPSFSAAGKGEGFDDPRHLWPDWARLIRECKPATVFGEQADDAIGYGWLDLVQTDLERENYAVGKAVLGACSVGAPHIRQRLYFCAANANCSRLSSWNEHSESTASEIVYAWREFERIHAASLWHTIAIESDLCPFTYGASCRVLRLRGYGDAIVPQVAAAFIQAYVESVQSTDSQTAGFPA
jgi:DNA (cytosine-5)-methyltransferase 1